MQSFPPELWTKLGRLIQSRDETIQTSRSLIAKLRVLFKRLLTAELKRRVHMEEQKAQQDKRLFTEKHIAYLIFGYSKVRGIETSDGFVSVKSTSPDTENHYKKWLRK